MEENTMCSRAEVEHIVERSTKEVKDAVRDLKSEHTAWQEKLNNGFDKRIAEIATAIVKNEKDSMVRFIGWGGIVGIVGIVYFFGGLTNQVENMQISLQEIKVQQQEVSDLMNKGDRFTTEDANELKGYVDQQDDYIIRLVQDGFTSLERQLEQLQK